MNLSANNNYGYDKFFAPIYEKLAIDSGYPVRETPFAVWPHFTKDEIAVVTEILSSGKVNYWTGGQGHLFEKEFASFIGTEYAIAVANGTVALELALYSLGIGPGDEVIVPSRTFIASASCVVMRGAVPVIADIDPVSQNITADSIKAVLTPKTKAIVAVHLAGWPCDMDPIMALAKIHGLKVIEDCAQAHGATYNGKAIGSIGDMAAFSFCQDKIMTTGGEGGMVTTNDRILWEKAWSFKDHGKSYELVNQVNHPSGFRWLHESFGTNMRMTEVQAGIGRRQLKKLLWWRTARRNNAAILNERFSHIPALRVTIPEAGFGHAYYKYYTFVRPELLRDDWDRDRIIQAINAEGIPCFSGSCSEIYREKAFSNAGLQPVTRLETAKVLGETSLMFLVHPTLNKHDMEDTCQAVEKVMSVAQR
jgi:dTDP-4-amino-4,6-dideoxygalactose transaminase